MKRIALVTAAALIALTGCAQEQPPVSDKIQAAYEKGRTLPATPPAPSIAPPAALNIEPGTKALFFGDSWTAGVGATKPTDGYAYVAGQQLQLNAKVDTNGSGTGYLNIGPEKKGDYATRLAAYPADPDLQLLVLQGGLNDPGAGNSLALFDDAVVKTIQTAKGRFPNARIVIVGPVYPGLQPGPDVLTVTASLRGLAEVNGLHFISGLQEHWLTPENLDQMIDKSKGNHPSTAGHAFIAQHLVEDLKKFAG